MDIAAHRLIPDSFTRIPSQSLASAVGVLVGDIPVGVDAVGYVVGPEGELPDSLLVDRDSLARAGFTARAGQTLALAQASGPVVIVVGAGPAEERTEASLRDAAAAFARAAHRYPRVGITTGAAFALAPETLGRVITEGVLLARYRYTELKPSSAHVPLVSLDIVVQPAAADAVARGARVGEIVARATNLARDLANCPPGHLMAADFADVALSLGTERGIAVQVFDKQQLIELGCGGLLAVNAGSVEEPRMIQLRYTPTSQDGAPLPNPPRLALVGKGIMYDSGGISLKPSDMTHLAMKMDMAGAGAAFAAMTTLRDLNCPTAVTAYLMCTDNMPSGSAVKLGDVLTVRGGTTVEVKNTDAEGRLVMSDALVLASEESPDAIVDIATLTGAALMALGPLTAVVIGNDQAIVDQVLTASRNTDESLWQLPLERRYRPQLDSEVADISNMGGPSAGSITAALFLAEFVGGLPWAHIDIAGTMRCDADDSWRSQGATGFGTRLLIDLAQNFRAESQHSHV
jgi:leucyl aminopeptidase